MGGGEGSRWERGTGLDHRGGNKEDPGPGPQARTGPTRAPRPLPAWAAALRATHVRSAHP